MSYKENKIGSAMVGDTGMPGSQYDCIWLGVANMGSFFEARAKWARGSNQGHLEEHDSLSGRNRGDSPEEALAGLLEDVMDWETGHPAGQIRSAFKDCQYEADDASA